MEERSSKSGEASIQVMSNPVRVSRRYAIVDGVMIRERVRAKLAAYCAAGLKPNSLPLLSNT